MCKWTIAIALALCAFVSAAAASPGQGDRYEAVGVAHGELLDAVAARLPELSALSDETRLIAAALPIAEASCSGGAPGPRCEVAATAFSGFVLANNVRVFSASTHAELLLAIERSLDGLSALDPNHPLTATQRQLLRAAFAALPQDLAGVDAALLRIAALETATRAQLNPSDAHIVLITTSVARHSMTYWKRQASTANSDWFDDDPTAPSRIKWGHVFGADAIGAAWGAAGGSLLGGVGAGPGAALGAGICSAGALLSELFN